ncbi:MAG: nitrogen regulation protein NR(II) [Acidobacteriota bacterium]
MSRSPLRTYAGQIRIVLVLLVLFLAVAIYCNVHLLVMARNAILDEAGRRLALQADLVRAELERDQMLRGLRASPVGRPKNEHPSGRRAAPGEVPYIPPTFLDRIARLAGMVSIDILSIDGRIITSSDPARVGGEDPLLSGKGSSARGTLMAGGRVVTPLDRPGGSRFSTLSAYRPIRDRRRQAVAFIRVEEWVPTVASVDRNLRLIAALQAGGLAFLLVLVILFARWLLQPYRRLLNAAGQAPGRLAGLPGGASRDGSDELVGAFQGVLDKLREQERELCSLKRRRSDEGPRSAFPGEHLVGGMTSAVLAFDVAGRLKVLNAAAERLLGIARSRAIGAHYRELLGGHERLVDLIERGLSSGQSHSREVLPLARRSGKQTHIGAMISPIRPPRGGADGAAAVEGVLCLLADLTEIRSLRERVGLKENLASLGEMSAGIAHEFRNSLATISGLARLIARNGGDGHNGAAREHAEAILREVRGVERVVRDFLRYARPMALDLSEVDLHGVVREAVAEFRGETRSDPIAVELEGSFPRIVADGTLIRQALVNLIRNAAEALSGRGSGAGGGARGAAPPPRIVVRGAAERSLPGGVRIVVEDNGPGIPRHDLPRLFTPFFTTRERGTGLGLALVQKAAAMHDGGVEVESEEGRGARFSILLPSRPGLTGPPASLS